MISNALLKMKKKLETRQRKYTVKIAGNNLAEKMCHAKNEKQKATNDERNTITKSRINLNIRGKENYK